MVATNTQLLTPGRSFRELTFESMVPDVDQFRHYSCLFHGVGQCDEYPNISLPGAWEQFGYDGVIEPGMVFTVESFVARRDGGEGVKLEIQTLITEDGAERLDFSPLDLAF